MKRKHNLNLLNEDIRLVSEKDDAYVKALGDYILTTINKFDVINTPFPMPYLKKALYGCVFLADELFERKQENTLLLKKIAELEAKLEEHGLGLEIDAEKDVKSDVPLQMAAEAKPKNKKNNKK